MNKFSIALLLCLCFSTPHITAKPAIITYPDRGLSSSILNKILESNETTTNILNWTNYSNHSVSFIQEEGNPTTNQVLSVKVTPSVLTNPIVFGLNIGNISIDNYSQLVGQFSSHNLKKAKFKIALTDGKKTWFSKHQKRLPQNWKQKGVVLAENRFMPSNVKFDKITDILFYVYPKGPITITASIQLDNLAAIGSDFFEIAEKDLEVLFDPQDLSSTLITVTGNINTTTETVTSDIETIPSFQKLELSSTATGNKTLEYTIQPTTGNYDLTDIERISTLLKLEEATGNLKIELIETSGEVWQSPTMSITDTWSKYSVGLTEDLFEATITVNETLDLNQIGKVKLIFSVFDNSSLSIATIETDTNLFKLNLKQKSNSVVIKARTKSRCVSTANASIKIIDKTSTQSVTTVLEGKSKFRFKTTITDIDATFENPVLSISGLIDPKGIQVGEYLESHDDLFQSLAAIKTSKQPIIVMNMNRFSIQAVGDPEFGVVEIDDKPFFSGDYVGTTPEISVPITDSDGVASYNIQITDESDTVVFTKTTDVSGNSVTASENVTTVLSAGTYTLIITATDTENQTATSEEYELLVSDSTGISNLVSGPNPFNPNQEVANIQYQLAKDADITLYIYSISGEKLFEEQYSAGDTYASVGFNSIEWSGENRWGEQVSNGVYIAILIADDGEKKVVKRHKIAVLK